MPRNLRMPRRRNDFKARPPTHHGPVTHGVAEYPGFHTALSEDTTWAYAQYKAVGERFVNFVPIGDTELVPDDVTAENADQFGLQDYPVIVALDMRGFKRLPDYDAVRIVLDAVQILAQQAVEDAGGGREDRDTALAALQWLADTTEDDPDRETPDTAVEALIDAGSAALQCPATFLLDLANRQDDPDAFIERVASGRIRPEELAEVAGQFRYEEDVPNDRITSVSYMRPFWPDILDIEQYEEHRGLAEALESAGWAVIDLGDIGFSVYASTKVIWERPPRASARTEYHGTSYRNLLLAAPEMRRKLPIPPLPYVGNQP